MPVSIVPARDCHVCQMLATGLREADVYEIAAVSGLSPEAALRRSVEQSERAWAALNPQGQPVVLFGVATWPGLPHLGSPWLLGTDASVTKHRRDFALHTPRYVEEMGRGYTGLSNFVSATNVDSIRWLHRAGFQFIDFLPEFGVGRKPFIQFFKAT